MTSVSKLFALAAICAPVFAGCKADLASDVYVRDLQEVMGGKEAMLAAPAKITLGFPGSMDQCKQEAGAIVGIVSGMFPNAEFGGCVETDGMQNELRIDVDVAIKPVDEGLFGGATIFVRDDGWLSMQVDAAAMERTLGEMKAENPMVSLDSFSATINVMNDTRDPVGVRAYNVFVDGEPVFDGYYFLDRRDDVEIVLPDVGAAIIRKGESYPIVQIQSEAS